MTDWQWVVPIIVSVVGVAGIWLGKRVGKESPENVRIDQLQEDVEGYRKETADLRREVSDLRTQVQHLLHRDAIWSVHVARQNGVIVGLGGDPLDLPKELQ